MKKKYFIFSFFVFLIFGFFLLVKQEPKHLLLESTETTRDDIKITGTTSLPTSAILTEKFENNKIQKFEKKLENIYSELPRKEKLQFLTEKDIHETPTLIRNAGLSLGEIAEAVEKDPSLAPAVLLFYEACAKQEDIASSVRALCFSNIKPLAEKENLESNLRTEELPAKIVKLAEKVN